MSTNIASENVKFCISYHHTAPTANFTIQLFIISTITTYLYYITLLLMSTFSKTTSTFSLTATGFYIIIRVKEC